jgi:hypothetical protein
VVCIHKFSREAAPAVLESPSKASTGRAGLFLGLVMEPYVLRLLSVWIRSGFEKCIVGTYVFFKLSSSLLFLRCLQPLSNSRPPFLSQSPRSAIERKLTKGQDRSDSVQRTSGDVPPSISHRTHRTGNHYALGQKSLGKLMLHQLNPDNGCGPPNVLSNPEIRNVVLVDFERSMLQLERSMCLDRLQ